MNDPIYVPLNESNCAPEHFLARTGKRITLSGNRSIIVGKVLDGPQAGGVAIRIERPEPGSERIALLEFGLTHDAAKALLDLLRQEL